MKPNPKPKKPFRYRCRCSYCEDGRKHKDLKQDISSSFPNKKLDDVDLFYECDSFMWNDVFHREDYLEPFDTEKGMRYREFDQCGYDGIVIRTESSPLFFRWRFNYEEINELR